MAPDQSFAHPPLVLSAQQRQLYHEQGYLCLEGLMAGAVARLQAAMAVLVERGRHLRASEGDYVIETAHTSAAPRLRRVYRAADLHQTFYEVATDSLLVDAVADLVGPHVKFRESYINFKWAKGGDPVKWHQDVPFFPHTNLSLITTLTYLEDCNADQGPLMVVPESHKGEIFDHYDSGGRWAACISDADLERAPVATAVPLAGPAGTVILMDRSGTIPNAAGPC